jgi:hypothetical protein
MPPAGGQTSEERFAHEDFARRLHKAMLEKGMSQSDLARKVWGTIEVTDKMGRTALAAKNRDRISVYLKGSGLPDPKNLSLIAKALGMTSEELAPDIAGAAIEREAPEISMVAIAGSHDKVLLRINKLIPLDVAVQVINLLAKI